jgi:hypothetical protein
MLGGNVKVDMPILNHANGIWDQALVALSQNSHDVQHPAKCARRVGSPAETKNIDIVTHLVVPHQELIRICDVVGNAVAKSQADDLCPPFADSCKRAAGSHCSDARMVIADLGRITYQSFIQLDHIGIYRAELIAGAVTADDDILRHALLPVRESGVEQLILHPLPIMSATFDEKTKVSLCSDDNSSFGYSRVRRTSSLILFSTSVLGRQVELTADYYASPTRVSLFAIQNLP